MKKPVKKAVVIHDLCGYGKAALTNIMPVLSLMQIESCPMPTMILSTHTGGLGAPYIIKCNNYIKNAFEHYKKINAYFDGMFIGYLGTCENVDELQACLRTKIIESRYIIFDPICADNGKLYSNFDMNYVENLKKIIQYAYVITPNYTEACLLTGSEIQEEISSEEIHALCRKLCEYGCQNVIVTSVPLENQNEIGTCIYEKSEDKCSIIRKDRIRKSYPGTGDVFTAVLLGCILNKKSLLSAAQSACEFVSYAIKYSAEYEYDTKEGIMLESCLSKLFETVK